MAQAEMTVLQQKVAMLSMEQRQLLPHLLMAVTCEWSHPAAARIRYLTLRAAYGEDLLDLAMDCYKLGLAEIKIESQLQENAQLARGGN